MKKMNLTKKLTAIGYWLFAASAAFAQYNKPNAVAYEPKANAYYVSNSGNGTITRIDSFFNTQNVITGLTNPQDILFLDLGANKALLVIDTNKIKVYDAVSYASYTDIAIPNALEIRSGVIDATNSNVFYLSDVQDGKIIKGVVGPAPLYIISFSTLASGISRPAGLLFDSKNRLLVVTDTFNASVLQINTSNGNVTTLKKTAIGNFHSIKEDAQGNYFVTNHSDSYLYRFNASFTDSVRLTSYFKPSGMYINTAQDMMLLACTGCGKIYYNLLHSIVPLSTSGICPGDSFYQNLNITFQGYGTYLSNNKFIVELSDSTGDFDKAITLGSVTIDKVPQSIKCKLPSGKYGNAHNVRVRATNPTINGSTASFSINKPPVAKAYMTAEASVCPKQSLRVGMNHISGLTYRWSGDSVLNDYTISNPSFKGADSGIYKVYVDVSNTVGCHSNDSVKIIVTRALRITNMADTLRICQGDTVEIGVTGYDYNFVWNPKRGLSDSTISNPKAFPFNSTKYVLTFSDTSGACSGKDSVEIYVYEKPLSILLPDTLSGCFGDSVSLVTFPETDVTFLWYNSNKDTLSTTNKLVYTNNPGLYRIWLTVTSNERISCYQNDSVFVTFPLAPQKPIVTKLGADLVCSIIGDMYQWLRNDVPLPGTNKSTITINDTGSYTVKVWDKIGCTVVSDPYRHTSGTFDLAKMNRIALYPNPTSEKIFLIIETGEFQQSQYFINDIFGRKLLTGTWETSNSLGIDVGNLVGGIYFLNVVLENRSVAELRFMKN